MRVALDDKALKAVDIETVSGGQLRVANLELARRKSAAIARVTVTSILMQALEGIRVPVSGLVEE